MRQYRSRRWAWLGGCLMLAWMLAAAASAAEDPYLAGLQDEAQKLRSLGEAKKEQEMLERQSAPPPKPMVKVAADARQAQFEAELEQYPAGFGLYQKLDTKDRDLVFQEYTNAPANRRHAAAIRKTIELSVRK